MTSGRSDAPRARAASRVAKEGRGGGGVSRALTAHTVQQPMRHADGRSRPCSSASNSTYLPGGMESNSRAAALCGARGARAAGRACPAGCAQSASLCRRCSCKAGGASDRRRSPASRPLVWHRLGDNPPRAAPQPGKKPPCPASCCTAALQGAARARLMETRCTATSGSATIFPDQATFSLAP